MPDSSEVESFVECTDVGGAVAELTEHCPGPVLIVDRERRSDRNRQMAADDAPAAQETTLDVEQVHRAAVSAGYTRLLAEQLGHDRFRRASDGERRGMVAVADEQVVVGFEAVDAADVGGLLPDGQMAVTANAGARVLLFGALLETPDEQHRAQQAARVLAVLQHVARPLGCFRHYLAFSRSKVRVQDSRINLLAGAAGLRAPRAPSATWERRRSSPEPS